MCQIAKRHSAMCQSATCQIALGQSAKCQSATCQSAVCHVPECHVPECHVPECHVPDRLGPECQVPECQVPECRVPECHVPECPSARVPCVSCVSVMCQSASDQHYCSPICAAVVHLDNCSVTCSAHDAERCDTLLYSLLRLCFHPWLQICAVANSCCITAACPLQEKAGLTMSQHCNVEVGSLSVRSEHLQPWNSITAAQSVLRSCTPQCHGG